ncbi:DNA adenine methylase [Reichenbachiella sp.]|uniref:DNA adenine methylase n=1 Tax=Reichenbachiella sp. TaxID=2184521 RepID=UPI003B5B2111
MTTTQIKTPISYYGGKQSMVKTILPLIPDHRIYVEPFFGGGAIFWAKEPSTTEVVNDVNMNIVNFYEVLKHGYFDLKKKVEATLHSRETYKKAMVIYDCPWLFADDPVVRAWAFYVVTNQGFGCKIGTWGYDRHKRTHSIQNKIDRFNEELSQRLKYVTIEENAAHKVISSRDHEDTFVYADPPYIDSNQGHYGGYSEKDFRRDLDALAAMKGKFLLSSYPSTVLDEYIKANGWHTIHVDKLLAAGNGRVMKQRKRKVEVLTANYEIK